MHLESQLDNSCELDSLIHPPDSRQFRSALCRLQILYNIYVATSPAPLPAPGLIITPEIRNQCERYLPITDISAIFNRLYAAALTYQPILSSTPFHNTLSWADTFANLPQRFQFTPNPAQLLESLLNDPQLLTTFLFTSFLPERFYGGLSRYPRQQFFIRKWLKNMNRRSIRCLDAACGIGEEAYRLAQLASEEGFTPDEITIEGWTLEPLEVWTANHRRLPHDRAREERLRAVTAALFNNGYGGRISFRCADIIEILPPKNGHRQELFDIILCNGLLGGPIMHKEEQLKLAVGNLLQLLAPGGIILTADNFHGGWKQKCPQSRLRASFEMNGLTCIEAGEGIGGLKPD